MPCKPVTALHYGYLAGILATARLDVLNRTADILVVDDDRRITSMLSRALRAEGYDVRTANDGSEGLVRVRERRPDLLVLDLLMPGVDGLEVCRRLREES